VDQALARRARAALPDPPWLLPALAELRERPAIEPAAPSVLEPPGRRPARRRPSAASVLLVVVALAGAALLAVAFVPFSRGPSFTTTPVEQSAPAAPARPPVVARPRVTKKPKPTPPRRAEKPKPRNTRQGEHTGAKTRAKHRTSKAAPAPKPRTLTRAQRAIGWRRFPTAIYYAVYLQRGGKTLYRTTTVRRGAVLPANLALRPGTYQVLVRPAIPGDAGIILGSAIFRKTMKL
jgi:hypothetical protein